MFVQYHLLMITETSPLLNQRSLGEINLRWFGGHSRLKYIIKFMDTDF